MGQLLRALHERQPLPAWAPCPGMADVSGRGLKPRPGRFVAEMHLGEATVMVEYEYEAAQRGTFDEPAFPAQVNIAQVLVHGKMVDADQFKDSVLDRWTQEILDSDHDA
jgi:hypothetical protein